MIDLVELIVAIMAAIIAYPQIKKGIVQIKNDVEALIEEIRRRRK